MTFNEKLQQDWDNSFARLDEQLEKEEQEAKDED